MTGITRKQKEYNKRLYINRCVRETFKDFSPEWEIKSQRAVKDIAASNSILILKIKSCVEHIGHLEHDSVELSASIVKLQDEIKELNNKLAVIFDKVTGVIDLIKEETGRGN